MPFFCLYYIANIHGYIVYNLLTEEWNKGEKHCKISCESLCCVKPCGQIKDYKLLGRKGRRTENSCQCLHTPEQSGTGMISELSFNGTHVFASYKHTIPSFLIHLPWLKETFLFGFSGGYSLIFDHSVGP